MSDQVRNASRERDRSRGTTWALFHNMNAKRCILRLFTATREGEYMVTAGPSVLRSSATEPVSETQNS